MFYNHSLTTYYQKPPPLGLTIMMAALNVVESSTGSPPFHLTPRQSLWGDSPSTQLCHCSLVRYLPLRLASAHALNHHPLDVSREQLSKSVVVLGILIYTKRFVELCYVLIFFCF